MIALSDRITRDVMGPRQKKAVFDAVRALGERLLGYQFSQQPPPEAAATASITELVAQLAAVQFGLDDIETIPNWKTLWAEPHHDLVVKRSEIMAKMSRATAPPP